MSQADAAPLYSMPPVGVPTSNPQSYFKDEDRISKALSHLENNDLRSAVIEGFSLSEDDSYVYHAIASVTLSQVQAAVEAGTAHGLCDWYPDKKGTPLGNPSLADIEAYVAIFSPTTASPGNALKSFGSNAKKNSLRSSIASNLLSKRYMSPEFPAIPKPSKAASKIPLFNPYFDFWSWSCRALGWAGPSEHTVKVKTSHAVLPIFMHHFGCVPPSREALEAIKLLAADGVERNAPSRTVLDIGSGNGYWAYVLRAHGLSVVAVDNQQSVFRANWIKDTIIKDGVSFLKSKKGAPEDVLLLVYPVVGGDFFKKMLDAYKGSRVVVAGTQCPNGYTGISDKTIDTWMEGERPEWVLQVRIPLPSFAGKDEALFVFTKQGKDAKVAGAKENR